MEEAGGLIWRQRLSAEGWQQERAFFPVRQGRNKCALLLFGPGLRDEGRAIQVLSSNPPIPANLEVLGRDYGIGGFPFREWLKGHQQGEDNLIYLIPAGPGYGGRE